MSPVATEERRMLPLGGGLKRSASFVISVDEVEVIVNSFLKICSHFSLNIPMAVSIMSFDCEVWLFSLPFFVKVLSNFCDQAG